MAGPFDRQVFLTFSGIPNCFLKWMFQIHRNGDHMEGYQQGGGVGGKVQGIRSINGRYKIDRGRLRIV